MLPRRCTSLIFVAFFLSAVPFAARADEPTNSAIAKQHYEEGTKALNLGEFKRAIAEYKAGYNAKPDPVFLYNMAQASRLDGDLVQAAFFYRSYLNNSPKAANRAEVTARIAALDREIARQKQLSALPPNGPVSPTLGPHDSAPVATVVPAQPAPPVVVPVAAPAPQPVIVETAPVLVSRPVERQPLYKKWWLWTAVGVVVVGVAVGVGVGVGRSGNGAPGSKYGTQPVF